MHITMRNSQNNTIKLLSVTLIILMTFAVEAQASTDVPVNIYTVTNTNDAGDGSLRRAINDANSHAGADFIHFNIPTNDPGYDSSSGVWTITLFSGLPELSDDAGVRIAGYSQSTYQGDTNPDGWEICLDGTAMGGSAAIIAIGSSYNAVSALALINGPGPGISLIAGASYNDLNYNYIGVGPDGQQDHGNDIGIIITSGASYNTINENVISGNTQGGISIGGAWTEYNELYDNRIGTNVSGTFAIPNDGDGVAITNGAHDNIIGRDESGNVISGNGMRGVWIDGGDTSYNEISHNMIGISFASDSGLGNTGNGVEVSGGAYEITIENNVISGNHGHGIRITGGGTWLEEINDNIIGGNIAMNAMVPNYLHGVVIDDAAYSVDLSGNQIVGNGWSGIAVVNSPGNNYIDHNHIGVSALGSTQLGNKYHGIAVVNSPNNTIILNHIAYNGTYAVRSGVIIQGETAVENTITQNSIHDNSGWGIELADGGNRDLFTPAIYSASCFEVTGMACSGCYVEVFTGSDGEGKTYEGTTQASQLQPSFTWTGMLHGNNVTVTQTNQYGDTSSFSALWSHACFPTFLPLVTR